MLHQKDRALQASFSLLLLLTVRGVLSSSQSREEFWSSNKAGILDVGNCC